MTLKIATKQNKGTKKKRKKEKGNMFLCQAPEDSSIQCSLRWLWLNWMNHRTKPKAMNGERDRKGKVWVSRLESYMEEMWILTEYRIHFESDIEEMWILTECRIHWWNSQRINLIYKALKKVSPNKSQNTEWAT